VTAVFVVTLAAYLRGSSIASTEDVIEADSADEAVAHAIREWQRVEPELTFQPLVVVQR
jgi:hypothetical protein